MPMVAIHVQNVSNNNAELFVTELIPGIDYLRVSHFLNAHVTKNKSCTPKLNLKLLVLAQSDRERELMLFDHQD